MNNVTILLAGHPKRYVFAREGENLHQLLMRLDGRKHIGRIRQRARWYCNNAEVASPESLILKDGDFVAGCAMLQGD